MTTKDDLVNIIKEWMELDDKIKEQSNLLGFIYKLTILFSFNVI